jgi:mitochondrial import inner membrane translocase subunit TIM50
MLSRIVPAVSRLGVAASRPVATTRAPLYGSQAWRHFASYSGNRQPPRQPNRPSQPRKPNEANKVGGSSQGASQPKQETETSSNQPAESEPELAKEIPFESLPDLTRGIPSTLEYETTGATRSALTAAPGSGSGGGSKGELPASAYISSTDRKRQKVAQWSFFLALAGLVGGTVYLGRDWDEDEAKRHRNIPNGWSVSSWWKRAATRSGALVTYFQEPAFEALLPPPTDPLYQKPYTLCISLEDMLVHSEWSREHGWRVAKRPGADYFLRYLSQYYELVLFTTVPFAVGLPIIQKLDPFQMITYPLFREATKYKDGECVKVCSVDPALTVVAMRC